MTKTNWYVVHTKPHYELKVAQLLTRKHIKSYCPLHSVEKSMFDSKKTVLEPLFNSFVFVHIEENELNNILHTPGVLNFLYWLNKPAIIADAEIDSLAQLLKEHHKVITKKCEIRDNPLPHTDHSGSMPEPNSEANLVKLVLPSLGYCIIARTN